MSHEETIEEAQARVEEYRRRSDAQARAIAWDRRKAQAKDLAGRAAPYLAMLELFEHHRRPIASDVVAELHEERQSARGLRRHNLTRAQVQLLEALWTAASAGYPAARLSAAEWAGVVGLAGLDPGRTVRRAFRALERRGLTRAVHDWEGGGYRPRKYPGRVLAKRRLRNVVLLTDEARDRLRAPTGAQARCRWAWRLSQRRQARSTPAPVGELAARWLARVAAGTGLVHTRTAQPGDGSQSQIRSERGGGLRPPELSHRRPDPPSGDPPGRPGAPAEAMNGRLAAPGEPAGPPERPPRADQLDPELVASIDRLSRLLG